MEKLTQKLKQVYEDYKGEIYGVIGSTAISLGGAYYSFEEFSKLSGGQEYNAVRIGHALTAMLAMSTMVYGLEKLSDYLTSAKIQRGINKETKEDTAKKEQANLEEKIK